MNRLWMAAVVSAVLTVAQGGVAQELTLGSKAPALKVGKFIKGEPVKGFEKGKTYVVEFWATWCGPCRQTIPHLTKLQKQYKDIAIIGVAILEEDQSEVGKFVEEMGDKMDYRVALDLVPEDADGDEGAMVKNWMEPAEQAGIPAAFIVNGDGVIAWLGHPGEIDDPLEKIVAGKWDVAEEARKLKEQREQEKKLATLFQKLQKLFGDFQKDGDSAEILKALDAAGKEFPDRLQQFTLIKFQILTSPSGDADLALKIGNELLENDEIAENADALNNIAWMLVSPDRDKEADPKLLKFALKLALKADNLKNNQDPSVADTLAKAYFDNGQLEKAVSTQERVVELSPGTDLEDDPGIKKRLRQYKRALESSKSPSK